MAEPRLIVDGNNVMGSRPDGWWRDRAGAARRLVAEIGAWAAEPVLVVFDGRAPDPPPAAEGVEVRYAGGGRDAADHVIAALVAAAADPRALRVVTSDAGLAGRVREHGAAVLGAGAFRAGLSPGSP
ncbi:MAG: NYN domain-containing protein [Solirubrobacteraceae bacterium]